MSLKNKLRQAFSLLNDKQIKELTEKSKQNAEVQYTKPNVLQFSYYDLIKKYVYPEVVFLSEVFYQSVNNPQKANYAKKRVANLLSTISKGATAEHLQLAESLNYAFSLFINRLGNANIADFTNASNVCIFHYRNIWACAYAFMLTKYGKFINYDTKDRQQLVIWTRESHLKHYNLEQGYADVVRNTRNGYGLNALFLSIEKSGQLPSVKYSKENAQKITSSTGFSSGVAEDGSVTVPFYTYRVRFYVRDKTTNAIEYLRNFFALQEANEPLPSFNAKQIEEDFKAGTWQSFGNYQDVKMTHPREDELKRVQNILLQ